MKMRHQKYRENQTITFTDDLILIGTGVLIGVIGYWVWSKNQEAQSNEITATQPTQTGVDSSGNPTYAQQIGPGGVGVFSNQQPAALPALGGLPAVGG